MYLKRHFHNIIIYAVTDLALVAFSLFGHNIIIFPAFNNNMIFNKAVGSNLCEPAAGCMITVLNI